MQLKDTSWYTILFLVLLATQLCSCAATGRHPPQRPTDSTVSPSVEEPVIVQPEPRVFPEPSIDDTQTGPRAVASLELTTQGKILLDQGRPDESIRLLERAVQLNPTNGRNYYYLAEAWIMKKNIAQAREFNDLAQMYFAGDSSWLERAKGQRERIEKGK